MIPKSSRLNKSRAMKDRITLAFYIGLSLLTVGLAAFALFAR
jgi:hypothetical protein